MARPSAAGGYVQIDNRLEWPQDLPGPDFWNPNPDVLHDLPPSFVHELTVVTTTCTRFWQKIQGVHGPDLTRDGGKVDDIHALQGAISALEQLATLISAADAQKVNPLQIWLEPRRVALIEFMEAVTTAETGASLDMTDWLSGPHACVTSRLDAATQRFHGAMARIDCPNGFVCQAKVIAPSPARAILQLAPNEKIFFQPPPDVDSWKIDDRFLDGSSELMQKVPTMLCSFNEGP